MSAITCPEGTLRADEEVTSLAECNLDTEDQPPLMETVTGILNVVVGVIAVMAVIVVIIGGVFFVTSQGDAGKVARARNTILYGVIGLVVALLALTTLVGVPLMVPLASSVNPAGKPVAIHVMLPPSACSCWS